MADFSPDEYFAEDRMEKLKTLRSEGHDPYPPRAERTSPLSDFVSRFADVDREELQSIDEEFVLVGRVERFNDIGGITFVDIFDDTENVQLFLQEGEIEDYEILKQIDESDYVQAKGTPMRTKRGELSLNVSDLSVVTKALRHPPSYEGFNQKNLIRQRGVAIRSDDLRDRLDDRFLILSETRDFLEGREFIEVDTPILQNIYGGGSATPFETYATAIDEDMFLRIAMELHLKRLLVGGYENIFEIGKTFRNEDIDTTHHPEFTMLELYQAYADYETMMDLTEDLVTHLLTELGHEDLKVKFDDETIDFSTPWRRLRMVDSIKEYTEIDVDALSDEQLREVALDHGAEFTDGYSRGAAIMELYEELVEDRIVGPTFVTAFPKGESPLCKSEPENPEVAERFELVVSGIEVANAFTELNDPIEQGQRFAQQLEKYRSGDAEAHRMDEDFIETLAFGMPPTGGVGIGMDRLVMLLTGSSSIKQVLPFPMYASEN